MNISGMCTERGLGLILGRIFLSMAILFGVSIPKYGQYLKITTILNPVEHSKTKMDMDT